MDLNQVVQHLQENPVELHIHYIPVHELRAAGCVDSSYDNKDPENHQWGFLCGWTTPKLNRGEPAPFSPMSWKSKHHHDPNPSSCHAEVKSVVHLTKELEWLWALMLSLLFADCDIETRRRQQYGMVFELGKPRMPYLIKREDPEYNDPPTIVVMDAKSGYDTLGSEIPGKDRGSALEAPVVKASLRRLRARLRW